MVTAKCSCGKSEISQRVPGGILQGHIQCHCSNCRKGANNGKGGPYGAPAIDWCCNVSTKGETESECTYGRFECCLPCFVPNGGGLIRTRCKECKEPLVAWGLCALTGFAAYNADLLNRATPEAYKTIPVANMFYNSGIEEKAPLDSAPVTYETDVGSLSGLLSCLLIPNICCLNCSNNLCCIAGPEMPPPEAYAAETEAPGAVAAAPTEGEPAAANSAA